MCMLHQRASGPMKRSIPIKGSRSRISFKRLLACVIIFSRVCRRLDRIGLGRKGGTKNGYPRLASGWWRIVSVVSREGRTRGFFWVGNLAFNLGKSPRKHFPPPDKKSGAKNPQFKNCFRPWGAEDWEILLFLVWGGGQTYVTLREKVTMKSGPVELVDVRYPFNHA